MKEEENLEEGMWKGKKIKDMSREEIIKALYDMSQLYSGLLKDRLAL